MKLTEEQASVLAGKSGPALALAMKTLVDYGEIFGATRLVPIKSAHLAGTFGAVTYKAYYRVLERLTAEKVRVKVPTTVNPRPGQDLHIFNRLALSKQNQLEEWLAALGATPNYSCVCYDSANVPEFGDWLALTASYQNGKEVCLDPCTIPPFEED